jgi:MYXO-CTERM domain-containing protein
LPAGFDPNRPVILGANGTLTYDASTGDFHAVADALSYTANGMVNSFGNGSQITLDVMLDSMGGLQGPGTFTVTGSLPGIPGPTLLSGTVTDFGADPAAPPTVSFNGLFDIQGGALTQNGDFPLGGPPGVFLLSAENVAGGTLGDFTQNFSSSSGKVQVGVSSVPAPAAWLLGVLGAGGLSLFGVIRRRRVRAGGPLN